MLKEQHIKFLDFYLATGNASESAKLAGYSPKSARQTGHNILNMPEAKEYLDKKQEMILSESNERIATASEVLEFLTSGMRNAGFKAQDRIKCAELLGKKHKLFTDKVETQQDVKVVVFEGEAELED